ncbi:MAG: MarR family transcriptional regulator [Oscillospiraceae bacterium]|nr:MarR family transcriptional regulator [Oscillospiraceae bacterium]
MNDASDCGMLVKLISDSIARISNNELRENDLTLSQLRYLEYLYAHPYAPTPFKELETHFQVSQPTAAGIIRRLESKGLILTQASECGGKARTAALTQRGKQLYEVAEARRSETETLLLAPLEETDKERFYAMLQKIYRNLKEV